MAPLFLEQHITFSFTSATAQLTLGSKGNDCFVSQNSGNILLATKHSSVSSDVSHSLVGAIFAVVCSGCPALSSRQLVAAILKFLQWPGNV